MTHKSLYVIFNNNNNYNSNINHNNIIFLITILDSIFIVLQIICNIIINNITYLYII